ncbi:MAG: response regulator transcription factor [Deltaproteobacteria bacterium]|nr:response regulator transcription factor [Deltaproteobacteria bacterium]
MIWSELTPEEHKEIHSFCRVLFSHGDVDEVRSESLLFLERSVGAEKSNFFLAEAPDKPVSFFRIVHRGIDDSALRHYRQYYWRGDPFYKKYAQQKLSALPDVLTMEDIVSYRNLTRTEYYNDFLKPQSIHHQMTIHLKSGAHVLGVVALFRGRGAGPFSHRDKLKARIMAPYLSGALRSAIAVEKNAALESVILSLLPDLPYEGLVILDRFLDPVYQDERATGILSTLNRSEQAPETSSGAVPTVVYRYCKEALSALDPEHGRSPPERRFDLFSSGSGEKVSVKVRPVLDRQKGPLFLLFLDPEEQILSMTHYLKDKGLTRREREVVHLLARGCRNLEIAQKLFISAYTVENHLRSIYRKMGVSNRTAVVHRLLQVSRKRAGNGPETPKSR